MRNPESHNASAETRALTLAAIAGALTLGGEFSNDPFIQQAGTTVTVIAGVAAVGVLVARPIANWLNSR